MPHEVDEQNGSCCGMLIHPFHLECDQRGGDGGDHLDIVWGDLSRRLLRLTEREMVDFLEGGHFLDGSTFIRVFQLCLLYIVFPISMPPINTRYAELYREGSRVIVPISNTPISVNCSLTLASVVPRTFLMYTSWYSFWGKTL